MVTGDAGREGVELRKIQMVSADGCVAPEGNNPLGDKANQVDAPRGSRPRRV